MILMLIILHISRSFTHAAPASLLDNSTVTHITASTQLPSTYRQRSIWDIIWSCLATIFACSWVSVHPNIARPSKEWWKAPPMRRLELMIWAILAPEVIILWAIRQWIGARKLAERYQDQGWTTTHGHFLQMGGFALFQGGDFKGILYSGMIRGPTGDEDIGNLADEKFPMTTKEEIQDRSKGDGLSKALAVGQTLWFVLQCIARRIEGLYITELELATGAFAVLNGVMYFLWWNKPLDVRCPVHISLLDTPGEKPQNDETRASQSNGWFPECYFHTLAQPEMISPNNVTPSAIFFGIFYRLAEIGDLKTPAPPGSTFYASTGWEQDNFAMKWASLAAIIFGGIHCVGWVFAFPSHAELIIWRVCSIVITTIPFITMAYAYIVTDWEVRYLNKIVVTLTIVSIPFYMIARVLLLAEAFTTLRDLPPGAYEVVRWVAFIPHV